MAFPHPESRQANYRNSDVPNNGSVVWELFKRTIDITDDRNAKGDVNPAKNRALGALVHSVAMSDFVTARDEISALLIAVGREVRDDHGKLLQHLRPAELRPLEGAVAEWMGEVEAGVLEQEACAVAIRLESEAHLRIDDWSAGRP